MRIVLLVDDWCDDGRPLDVGGLKVEFPVDRRMHVGMLPMRPPMSMSMLMVVRDVLGQTVSDETHPRAEDLDCTRSGGARDVIRVQVNGPADHGVDDPGVAVVPPLVRSFDEEISVDPQRARTISMRKCEDYG